MIEMTIHPLLAIVLAYVAGSFPSAWLAGKWSGVDLRAHGSGNLGATNVLRVLGPRIGATVFLADIAKGAAPVALLPPRSGLASNWLMLLEILCGAAAILGHARPVFLGFRRSGKGVATACGVFLALAPLQALAALATFAVVVMASGFVSLASLSGAFALPVVLGATFGLLSPLVPVGVATFGFVAWTHRENIKRLRAGTEYQFSKSLKLAIVPSLALGSVFLGAATAWFAMRGQ